MICSFRCRETERLFLGRRSRRLPPEIQQTAFKVLLVLDAAQSLQDLWCIPGLRLEKLRGERKGEYSLRVNRQWRVCFHWCTGEAHGGEAHGVEIVDYH
ncbi:MAG TPA: type II toxin-antitoxin system RelE/ParE family toxin [Thermoanaerobaculia bacterium]|nr:type II toxin-antitoxin system RelE/ParE family toxin [Thermoanaerobaculia bacterium]